MPLEKLSWIRPTLECHWINSNFCSLHWNTTGGTVTASHAQTHIVKHAEYHPCQFEMTRWRDTSKQVDRCLYIHPLFGVYCSAMDASSALNTCEYFNITLNAFDMSTIIVFVYLGLQVKWNQFSLNNSHHTSCIHKGSHAGKWPDLMPSKPDYVSTLGYHWTDHTGTPLESQVHWDATGARLADASTQWCFRGDPVLICIIGTHWKTTGATGTLGCHWNHTGWC